MKKIMTALAILIMIGSMVNTTSRVAKATFFDLNESHPFYDEIMYLSDHNIVRGTTVNAFHPQDKVTRAAAATMIGRALGLDGSKRTSSFSDVSSQSYAAGYIESAVEKGIIKGYSDDTFRPDAIVNRGEMAIFLARAFELEEQIDVDYYDIYKKMASYESIKKVSKAGIAQGLNNGFYLPYQDITRAEFSAFLARALEPEFKVEFKKFKEPSVVVEYKRVGSSLVSVNYPNWSTFTVEPSSTIVFKNMTKGEPGYVVDWSGNAVADYMPMNGILLTNTSGTSHIQVGGGLTRLDYYIEVK
ncbi:S-layer homology domain-containing protein [Rossellomorea sp. YZS02]|uniref:S-layer homology domain-containing protein n=1 Tax=Rossellomorea sp. YZS02 TaxID=3097358 RepID=UPI002A0F3B1D|nr:S-layer homology domain-containing protein [Rossellomorea sp. YZS02]MDX8346142.1 S-layer homology domain-containing protein [Rossellomorea sp. YZS02]